MLYGRPTVPLELPREWCHFALRLCISTSSLFCYNLLCVCYFVILFPMSKLGVDKVVTIKTSSSLFCYNLLCVCYFVILFPMSKLGVHKVVTIKTTLNKDNKLCVYK
jgi:hypothetical protein